VSYVTPAAQRILQLKARISELEAENERMKTELAERFFLFDRVSDARVKNALDRAEQAEKELAMLNDAEQLNYERILQLKAENEQLKVCGTCARCRAAGVCQSDWPLREYATAHSTAYDLHSKCWREGALGWVAYWTEPEEEKKNVLKDMKTTGYRTPGEPE
jgi:hypothetical protein